MRLYFSAPLVFVALCIAQKLGCYRPYPTNPGLGLFWLSSQDRKSWDPGVDRAICRGKVPQVPCLMAASSIPKRFVGKDIPIIGS